MFYAVSVDNLSVMLLIIVDVAFCLKKNFAFLILHTYQWLTSAHGITHQQIPEVIPVMGGTLYFSQHVVPWLAESTMLSHLNKSLWYFTLINPKKSLVRNSILKC